MKKLKFLNSCLLAIASSLLVTAIIAFVYGKIFYGICNILWFGCGIFYFLINKKSIETTQQNNRVYYILSYIKDLVEKHGAAIITEDKDGKWVITAGIAVEHKEPSCSAENNDQINYHHIAEEVGGVHE